MFKTPKFTRRSGKNCAGPDLSEFLPGHTIAYPSQWRAGVVFASPHSGHLYPQSFLDRSPLSANELRRNEDIYIEKLFASVVLAGAPLLLARFPRCFVDPNRAADEIWHEDMPSQGKPSARAAAGLGVVPTHLNEATAIYRKPLSAGEIRARIDTLYHPYHAALRRVIDEAKARFGQALLVDCHSMPGFAPMGARRPDVILGDRFGAACHPDTMNRIRRIFEMAGYSVGINYPYAGGFVTQHYGQPETGVEAIQIEINRDLYLNPVTLAPKRGYEKLSRNLDHIITEIIEAALPQERAAQ
ncbi:N-formylglutamate amidohydrolase [Litorimonas sp. RW-G-Af-16]|uniref:N-formylglutamate amidohydrolase n=1 Tax=Litorimonas sp. RW-G-Af-16 TaxID=3241168 RepID=UPI00390C8AA0